MVADPLVNMTMPNYISSSPPLTQQTNSCTDGPGIYDSLSATSCTMAPGLYVLTGSTHLSGSTAIVAPGVTLYFVCGTQASPRACNPAGEAGGDLIMTGGTTLTISAPTGSAANQVLDLMAELTRTSTFSFRVN